MNLTDALSNAHMDPGARLGLFILSYMTIPKGHSWRTFLLWTFGIWATAPYWMPFAVHALKGNAEPPAAFPGPVMPQPGSWPPEQPDERTV